MVEKDQSALVSALMSEGSDHRASSSVVRLLVQISHLKVGMMSVTLHGGHGSLRRIDEAKSNNRCDLVAVLVLS